MQFDMKVMLREHWPICQTRFTSHSQVQQKRCAAVSVQVSGDLVVAGGISKFHLLRRSAVEAAFGLSCKVGSVGGSGRVGTTGGGREGDRVKRGGGFLDQGGGGRNCLDLRIPPAARLIGTAWMILPLVQIQSLTLLIHDPPN